MTIKSILSIDPGKAGGMAWCLDSSNGHGAGSLPMPDSQGDTLTAIRTFARSAISSGLGLSESPETLLTPIDKGFNLIAYVEQVGGFMGVGGKNVAAAHTMFAFGENFGFLKGVLQTLGFKVVMIHPKKWQKHFSLGAKKDCATPREWKAKLQAEAQRRFPTLNVTRGTADALLLLDYAVAQERQLL